MSEKPVKIKGLEGLAALKGKPKQPEQTPIEKKQHKRREIVTAAEWKRVVDRHLGMKPKERAAHTKEVTYDVTVEDIRDFAVSIAHEAFGRDDAVVADELRIRGAIAKSTFYNWKMGNVLNPRMSSVRRVALTCGWDLRFVKVGGKE